MEAGPAPPRAQVSPRRLHPQPRPSSTNDLRPNPNTTQRSPTTNPTPRPNTADTSLHKPNTTAPQQNSTANIPQQKPSTANSPSAAKTPQQNAAAANSSSPGHKAAGSRQQSDTPRQRAAEEEANAPELANKIHVSGFPPYTQMQDVAQIFSRFGNVRIDKINPRLSFAVLQFSNEREAKAAIQQTNKKVAIYGEFLYVRPYTAVSKNKQHVVKRDFTKSKQRGEIIDPRKIDLSGEFAEQMERILSTVRLTQEEATTISMLYSDVERVLQLQWPGCVAMPFGSITTGLGIKSSDADCYVHVAPAHYRAAGGASMLVNKAKRLLQSYPALFTEILSIPRANTPIVKFFHLPTSTNCDLSFKTPLGAQNSRLIAFLLHGDPRLLPLAVLVKYWAKVHGLSGTGKLTNYALTMMIIFYLQQPPLSILPPVEYLQRDSKNDIIIDYWNTGFNQNKDSLPVCTNTSSVMELLGGFFEFYSKFNFEQMVICPYLGEMLDKKLFHDLSKLPDSFKRYIQNVINGYVPALRVSTPFVVQDPFEQSHNVTSPISIKLAAEIKAFFKFAANAYDKEKLNRCKDFFKTILLQKPKITKVKAHPEYRVNIFPKLVQSIDDPDWKSVVQKTVLLIFQTMLKIKLEKIELKVNPETLKEKERYKGGVTKPIWKRKQFTKLYSVVNLDFAEKQAKITEEVMNAEKEVIDIQLTVMMTFANDPKSAAITIKLAKGEATHFGELGRFFITHMQSWFTTLVKPYTKSSPVDSAAKLTGAIKTLDSNLENNTLDSDDDDSTTENVDTNTAESDSEKEDDMEEDREDDEDPPSEVKSAKIEKESGDPVPGTAGADTH